MVGRATLADDLEAVRRIDQAITRGNEIFRAWALAAGGSVVEVGGDEGRVEVPAIALKDLAGVRANYESAVEAPASVGVGKRLSESAKALLAAKLRGGNTVVFFDTGVDQEVAAAQKDASQQTETQKITEEYLAKDEAAGGSGDHGGGVSKPHKQQAGHQTAEHSQGEVAESQAEAPAVPAPEQPKVDFEGHFRAAADSQDQADKAATVRQSQDYTALKEQVATALEGLRKQLPVLNQMKSAYPQTYQSVLAVVQSVIALGRELQTQDTELAKKERSTKVWKSPGWGRDVISIPSTSHPDRKAWDAAITSNIASRYTRGDTSALKPVKIPLAELGGGNSAGAANSERLGFYRKVFRSGDRPHPVVAMGGPGNYRLVDGTHRADAARAEGLTHINAMLVPSLRKEALKETEVEPDQEMPGKTVLDKGALPSTAPHKDLILPVGTQHHGQIKVLHADGKAGWKGVRAGMIQGQEPNAPMLGANSHPVSSREPGAK